MYMKRIQNQSITWHAFVTGIGCVYVCKYVCLVAVDMMVSARRVVRAEVVAQLSPQCTATGQKKNNVHKMMEKQIEGKKKQCHPTML